MRGVDVRPVAQSFQTENSLTRLPAVAEKASGTWREGNRQERLRQLPERCPAIAELSPPAAVRANVEAAPIVHRSQHRWRCRGIGPRWKIGGESRSRHCNGANRAQ